MLNKMDEFYAEYGVTSGKELRAAVEANSAISLIPPYGTDDEGVKITTKSVGRDWLRLVFAGLRYTYLFDSTTGWSYTPNAGTDYMRPANGIPIEHLSQEVADEIRNAYEVSGRITGGDVGKVIAVMGDRFHNPVITTNTPPKEFGIYSQSDVGDVMMVASGKGQVTIDHTPYPTEIHGQDGGPIINADIGKVATVDLSDKEASIVVKDYPSEVPVASAADNGSVLMVKDGVWNKVSLVELLVDMGLYTPNLATDSWATISAISASGNASNYYAVGDCKLITLNGTVGTLSLDNYSTYVFILGFNHNAAIEGNGISFGCFKAQGSHSFKDICLADIWVAKSSSNGSKAFNMNHWGSKNIGGWAGCDLRYDILGSTDVPPSDYGYQVSVGRTGYNPTLRCTSSPVPNTLMSCMPSDLRAVMKPITKYTDNVANTSSSVQTSVTPSVDYLPLMAEYEVFGSTGSNSYEPNYQAQYSYYANGMYNGRSRYKHDSLSTTITTLLRSPKNTQSFRSITSTGQANNNNVYTSYGVAPVFLV